MAEYDAEIRVGTSVDTSQMKKMQLQIDKADAATEKFAKALEKAKNTKVPTDEYKAAQKVISDSEKQLNKFVEKQDELARKGREGGAAWNDLEYKIESTKQQIMYAKSDAEELVQEGKAFNIDSSKVDDLSNKYDFAKRNAEILRQKQSEVNQKISESGQSSESMAQMCQNTADKIRATFAQLPSVMGQAFKSGASACKSALSKIGSFVKGAASKFVSLGSKAKSALSSITRHGSKSSSMLSGFTKRVIGLAKRVFVFSLITKAFRAMVTGAQEGLQNFAKVNTEYNESMSSLKSATSTLKNSLATAFAPILNAIIPTIVKLIGWVNSAATAIARFTAILGGKSTYTKATTQVEDYASSLDDASDSAESAAKSLASFDDLNVLSDSSSSSGSSSSDTDASDMFEEADVGEVSDWAQAMKDAIDSGDWYGVGSLLAEKINTVLAEIDFTAIDTKMQQVATNIATGLNGFIENLNWNLVGQTLANGLNVAINFLYTFITTFNFAALGTGIADGINGFLETTNWSKLGETIGSGIQGIISFLNGFVTTFDWTGLGTAIYQTINSTFSSIDWGMAGNTISEGIKGILTTIETALAGIEWAEIAHDIEDFLVGVDWSGIVSQLASCIGTALGGLCALLGTFISDAWDGVVDYFSKYIEESGGNIIAGLWNGIVDALANVGQWIVENIFDPFIDGFKSAFDIHSPSKVMADMGDYLIQGLLNGITETWEEIKTFCSTAFTNLKESIEEFMDSIKTSWDGKWDSIKSTITTLFGTGEGSIRYKISEAMKNIKEKIDSLLNGENGILTIWEKAWTSIKDTVSSIFDDTWTKIKSVLQTILDGIGGMVNKAIDTLNNLIDKLNSFGFDLPDILGGGHVGFSISKIEHINIPQLAEGAVIKGGNPFAAILGDQRAGQTNIETPLDTMIQAFKTALSETGYSGGSQQATVVMQVSEREFGRAVVKFGNKETQRIGISLVD